MDENNFINFAFPYVLMCRENLAKVRSILEKIKAVKIQGATNSIFKVADFLKKLKESPYFTDIQLNYAKKDKIDEREIVTFEIESNFSK